ncbi:Hypothetical protein NTJ_15482 [Nesidiocoris tenuis]|uniref:BESS domain-containing protein n=2 Tax=Nesidiocoris tenuis TaxID=355587 RepID=A0ABN7BEC3_9HEMI|nr:Hypothetical protein NTJ_15482 [Nesidiocoris tenuis]
MEDEEGCFIAESDDESSSIAKPLDPAAFLNYGILDGKMTLRDQAAQLVVNVQEYFKKERERQAPLISPDLVVERASAALKLDPRILVRIGSFYTKKSYNQRYDSKSDTLHPLRVEAIINFMEMCYQRDKGISFTKASEKLVKSGLFKGSRATLRRLLVRHGFDFTPGSVSRRCNAIIRAKPEYIFEDFVKDGMDEKGKNGWVDPKTLEPPESLHCDEDDLGFFRSILPSLSELDERDKFNFRLTVMNKVNEILYKPCEKSEVDDVEMKLTNGSPEKESASVVERTCDARATDVTKATEETTATKENKATEETTAVDETTAARGSTNSPRKPAPQASTKGGSSPNDDAQDDGSPEQISAPDDSRKTPESESMATDKPANETEKS